MHKLSLHTVVVAGIILLASIVGHALWNYYMNDPWTRDSRVRADVVDVAPDVSGFLTELNVRDNQLVHAGDVLFTIDKSRYEIALQQATAILDSRKAKMEQAERDAKRYLGMKEESISAIDRDQKESAAVVAEADYHQALADQAVAKLNLDRTTYKAPIDGYVTNADLRIGGYQSAGHPLFALVASDSFYIAAYMEETKLQRVHSGDKALVRLMGVNSTLTGHVESIARGTVDRERTDGATLLPNVNPTFSWIRLAQRIPVRIALDPLPPGVTLVAGQTATVTIAPGGH
jgi:RND family efflux transporter MFP subunit